MKNFLTLILAGDALTETPNGITLHAGDSVAVFTLGYAGRITVQLAGVVEGNFDFGTITGVLHADALRALAEAGFTVASPATRAKEYLDNLYGSVEVLGGGRFATSTRVITADATITGVVVI